MRPWTTRTLNAVVVAAGFATAGTGVASAAPSDVAMPDLTQVPDEIGFTAPLDTCHNPGVPGREKAPCADVTLQADSPNVIKEVGKEVTTTSHALAGELSDKQPVLAPGEPNRLLAHAAKGVAHVEQMADTRPTVGVQADPQHTGLLNEKTPKASLLDAEVGPRQPDHEGFSAADTAVDATVAQGFSVKPMTSPVGDVAKVSEQSPLRTSGAPVTLPKVGDVVPAAKQAPALASVDDGLANTVGQTGQDPLVQHLG